MCAGTTERMFIICAGKVMEMGGKDGFYISDDVAGDVSAVAEKVANGKFDMNGENCDAIERIYVHEGSCLHGVAISAFWMVFALALCVRVHIRTCLCAAIIIQEQHFVWYCSCLRRVCDGVCAGGRKLQGQSEEMSATWPAQLE